MTGNDCPNEAICSQSVTAALAAIAGTGNLDQRQVAGMPFVGIAVVESLE